jgi:hypothetical protein
MMKLLILIFLSTTYTHAFTLNNNFGAGFKDNKVKVYVDADTTCISNLLTPGQLEAMIGPAVDKFWNEVPTSALKLEAAGFSPGIPTINHGRLCSPTDDKCISDGEADATRGLIPPVNNIVIACNDHPDNFDGGNVLAVTIPNKFSGQKIAGAVVLINNNSASFGKLSHSDQIAVIAHEIGHAIGLGHSDDRAALMYYRTVDLRRNLGQDDVNGVSYLYPVHFDGFGLLGGCGTISDGKNPPSNPPFWQMGITLGLLILIFESLKLFYRTKTRATA